MKIVISIVNFNTKEFLKDLLDSFYRFKYKNKVDIWILDNASKDGSVEMIKKQFPEVNLIEGKINVGFGAGHNVIFKKTKADFFLILNPDSLFTENVIDKMVEFMEKENCHIASCKVFSFDGKLQPNAGNLPFGLSLIGWLFNLDSFFHKSFHIEDIDFYESAREVGWVSGNFMIIKAEVLQKLGGFNEKYFMYFEDVEICFRARNLFKIMINPRTSIRHFSGGSLENAKFSQWSGEIKGLVKFYRNQYGLPGFLFIKSLSYLSVFLRMVVYALIGKFNFSLNYGKVIFSI